MSLGFIGLCLFSPIFLSLCSIFYLLAIFGPAGALWLHVGFPSSCSERGFLPSCGAFSLVAASGAFPLVAASGAFSLVAASGAFSLVTASGASSSCRAFSLAAVLSL